jgi:hypothetical protein
VVCPAWRLWAPERDVRVERGVVCDVAGAEATDWANSECRVLRVGGEEEGATGGGRQAQLRCEAVGIYYVEREHTLCAKCRSIAIGPQMTTPPGKGTIGANAKVDISSIALSTVANYLDMLDDDSCLASATARFDPCI